MKVCFVDEKKQMMVLFIDYWEAEILGFDVKKNKDVSGSFFQTIIEMISVEVKEVFGSDFNFGIKTYVDDSKGLFYYEIKPYNERLDEFIMEEMVKNNYSIKYMFPYGL